VPPDNHAAGRAQRRLTAEYVAARALAESASLAEAAQRVLQAMCEALDWDHGALWSVDTGAGVMRCVHTWHLPAVSLPEFENVSRRTAMARGIGLPGRVWASGEPAWVPDVVADPNFPRAAIAMKEGLHGAFALPILTNGRVVGVMEFFSREIREPDADLLGMLTQVGAHIGQFMERRRAEEELGRFFDLSLDLLCLAGFDGYFKRLNPAWERVLGYTTEELLARPYLDFVHPDDRNPTTTAANQARDGSTVLTVENRYIAKDGSIRWLQWNAVPLPSEQMVYCAARDVTERKQAKETIARYSRDLKASREAEAANASRLAKLVSELEVRDLLNVIQSALGSGERPTIEVVSAVPGWVELIVPCTLDAAEGIQPVVERLAAGIPEDVLESVAFAFRELVMNAIEWGGRLDPSRKVRITCVRTDRMLMYRIADPGPGFTFDNLDHAAITHDNPIDHVFVRDAKGLRPGGFGVLTVRASVDELVYNQKQNEVIFIKYLTS
jgi:PAS domain S-box-containing protein